jgi:PAS domain S-box-containing protein
MSTALALLGDLVSVSLLLLGIGAIATWLRTRDLEWGALALAIVLLAGIQVTGWLYSFLGGPPPLVRGLQLLGLIGSAYCIFRFRDLLVAYGPRWRLGLTCLIGLVAVGFGISMAAALWSPDFFSLEVGAADAGFLLWLGILGEASIRFWRGSGRLPAVQRARMRCLSVGLGGFAVDTVVGQLTQRGSDVTHVAVNLVGLAVIALLYLSYNPPRPLRRVWREPEEEQYRIAMDDLLGSNDASEILARALPWAIRRVGGEGGIVASAKGEILQTVGLTPDQAERLSRDLVSAPTEVSRWSGDHKRIAVQLPADRESRLLVVAAGALTPLFASDEITLLRRYGASVGLATERARLAMDLADEQMLRAELLESISEFGIGLMASSGGTVTLVNDAYTLITGYSADDLNRTRVSDLVPAAQQRRRGSASLNVGDVDGSPVQSEFQVRTRDGRLIDVDGTARTNSVGGVPQTIGMIRDITEPKRTQRLLQESEERFRLLVSNVKDYAILNLDLEGHVVTWNGGAEAMKGYTADEIIGQHFSRFYSADDVLEGKPERQLAMAAAVGSIEDEGWRVRKDGSRFWADVVITALHDKSGRLRGFGKVTRDITERKRVEDEIRALNVELVDLVAERTSANQELEAFSYSVSHDLRAPLRAINGFTSALVADHREDLPAAAREYLDDIATNGRNMSQLIDDLLAFSRLGRQLPNRHTTYPEAVVKQVLEGLERGLDGRDVRFSIGKLPPCQADPALLAQAYTNLLTNAIKFTRRRAIAEIEVGSFREGEEDVYFVRDNGVGFNPIYQAKLFGVFQRLHRADEFEGTGVGLAIVQRVVHRHGGRVWAEGRPGQGATFFFTLRGGQDVG